jgi:hypothetical protein
VDYVAGVEEGGGEGEGEEVEGGAGGIEGDVDAEGWWREIWEL